MILYFSLNCVILPFFSIKIFLKLHVGNSRASAALADWLSVEVMSACVVAGDLTGRSATSRLFVSFMNLI